MITNSQMKSGRFLRWQIARDKLRKIQEHLAKGGQVQVATCTKATIYKPSHIDSFRCDRLGLYVRRGKSWDCIDYCAIGFSR